jgi:ADP-heptose:LPS heptosyltransferase
MGLLQQLPRGSRVCVIRLRSMGDCVLTTPALSLLKTARPDLKIGVAVEPRFAPIFEGNPAVSKIIDPNWSAVRRWRAELCVNLHGGSRSFWMTLLSGSKWRAGFAHHNFTFAYNVKIGRAQTILGVRGVVHTAEHLASAFFALGVPITDVPRAQLFVSEQQAEKVPVPGRYAVLHPFAATPDKRWPAEKFCELARYLTLWKIEPVILAGAGDDTAAFAAHRVFRGSLPEAKALISKASLFVGNDSGPAHIAAAFGLPTVVLFGPSKPAIWGPWRTESEVVVGPDGLADVPVSRVISALERLRSLEEAHA